MHTCRLSLALLKLVTSGSLAHVAIGQTYLASPSTLGGSANDGVVAPSVSADGRFVVFHSAASNLVEGDTNNTSDVFVHDRRVGNTTRVSVSAGGVQGNGQSGGPDGGASISADGRFVAFYSLASNLVPGDTNFWSDVFVHDRLTGAIDRVSVSSGGTPANGSSFGSSISADGRYVAFVSDATNLVAGDTGSGTDVFVHDRQTGATTRVNVGPGGVQANAGASRSSISGDGRHVVFVSFASNLVPGDTNGWDDVFVHDRQTGTTIRAAVGLAGAQPNGSSGTPSISFDGRLIAFSSGATNLVSQDTNGQSDIFVYDRQANTTTRVSVSTSGDQANGSCIKPSMSADGRYVAFASFARNLVTNSTLSWQIYVHDRETASTVQASLGVGGSSAIGRCDQSAVSADGRFVVFDSDASNLVVGPTSSGFDVFVRDIRPCFGDADDDRAVVFADITSVLGNFGNAYPRSTGAGDATLDGLVNFLDITTVLANWGTVCD